jgi:hypothetical protein
MVNNPELATQPPANYTPSAAEENGKGTTEENTSANPFEEDGFEPEGGNYTPRD